MFFFFSPPVIHPNLPSDAAVDGLVQLDDEHLVSKVAGSGVLFVWRIDSVLDQNEKGAPSVMIEPTKLLNWSDTDEMYLNMIANQNMRTLVTGDANGKIWIHSVIKIIIKIIIKIVIIIIIARHFFREQ